MTLKENWIVLLFMMVCANCFAQEEASLPLISSDVNAEDRFGMYVDSIEKYIYRDVGITEHIFHECENLLKQGTQPADSIMFFYRLNEMLYKFSDPGPLGAFKVFTENQEIFNNKLLPPKMLISADYYEAFIYMEIGDLELAQSKYYQNIETARSFKDTSAIVSNLYSLGQLYSDEGDYEASLKCYEETFKLADSYDIRTSTQLLLYLEKAEVHQGLEDYPKALEVVQTGIDIAEGSQFNTLLFDLIILKGNIYINQGDIESAEETLLRLKELSGDEIDMINSNDRERFRSRLYEAKGMYSKAIQIRNELLDNVDSTNLVTRLSHYGALNELHKKNKNIKEAYRYLLKYKEFNQKKIEDEKRQKTSYLKIKYESDENEKERILLESQLAEQKAKRKLLFAFLFLVLIFFAILAWAFYQKSSYNKLLEKEVEKRTLRLKESNEQLVESNKELDEFNRILSHDLKEPIRNIVSFSQLTESKISDVPAATGYLKVVQQSGRQLHRLIDDVAKLRRINIVSNENDQYIDMDQLLFEIKDDLIKNYNAKYVEMNVSAMPKLNSNLKAITTIFSNVIDNAIKFNNKVAVKINVEHNLVNDWHVFHVKDNGIGIKNEFQSQIFDLFKRLNTCVQYPGAGLGLSISRRLLQQLGGEISVLPLIDNEHETTFEIRLPIKMKSFN